MTAARFGRKRPSRVGVLRDAVSTVVPDGVTMLTVFVLLLYAVPSNRSISALGAAGSIALIWGVGSGLWWCWHQLQRGVGDARPGPLVRTIGLALVGAALLSYVAAMTRALPPEEANPADTGLIRIAGLVGVLLVAADGPPNLSRLMQVLRRVAFAGGLFALLGLAQFALGQPLVDQVPLPGLSPVAGYESLESRGGFTRPVATSTHPLEYALVLTAILPLALAFAVHDTERGLLRRWFPPAAIALALALSSSRSAYVGLAVGMLMLLPTIGRRGRALMLAGAAGVLAIAYVAAPRVITNLRYLFIAVGDDTSAASRTDSYTLALDVAAHSPIIGRGFGTFLPQYRILDNQFLLTAIELGIVGLAVLIALILTAIGSAFAARRRLADPLARAIAGSLAASVAAAAGLLALFDAFAFPQAAGTLFLMIGLCGAFWRLSHEGPGSGAPLPAAVVRDSRVR